MKKIFILSIFLVALSSCVVTKKKYDDLLAQKVRLDADLADRDTLLTRANKNIESLDEQVRKLSSDTTALGQDVRATTAKLAALDKEYTQLNAYYKNLLNSSGKLNRDMAQQQEQLLAIQNNLERTRKLNDSLSVSLTEREKKVRELENIMAAKDKAVNDLKNSISNALLNFKENDLTVNVKNGKVYVSLAEQLLFASGSTVVDAKGVT
ncbi:MAG TPA: hypothetical protein VFM90_10465, partial [Cyclobacteriaceae bacterium]|nr:hypothetical protein [Cyclobacteriaceae bacterium]